jgi:hypothetical protein
LKRQQKWFDEARCESNLLEVMAKVSERTKGKEINIKGSPLPGKPT